MNWSNDNTNKIQVIAPGLVFLKSALNVQQQRWLAKYAIDAGSREHNGFWLTTTTMNENNEKQKILNSDKSRGRIYDDVENFPDPQLVQQLCHSLVDQARDLDNKMPQMDPTHLLLLYYASEDGMEWHSDSDVNDGNNDHPIVSITIGNACDFGYKLVGKQATSIRLESGDVLIWGGPNRMLYHCVERVYGNTVPDHLSDILENVRLNFTYRDAPNVRGREHEFKYNLDGFNVAQ
jgi:alkylated DNA repair dioxygenase AlkB